jgi:hypothetical protein
MGTLSPENERERERERERETSRELLCYFYQPGSGVLPDTESIGALNLDFPSSRTGRN